MNTVKFDKGNVKLIAHRGLSGIERENTAAAFVAAGNRSYYGIETDVHISREGHFVIIHDETTERITNGAVVLNAETAPWTETARVVLPDLDGVARTDLRIPRLSEYIRICKKYGKIAVLELKNKSEPSEIAALVEEIKALGYIDGLVFISFHKENCVVLRELLPNAEIQFLFGDEMTEAEYTFLATHRLGLDLYYPMMTKEVVLRVHKLGQAVNCWTCDDPKKAEELVAMGVDFITSNILE